MTQLTVVPNTYTALGESEEARLAHQVSYLEPDEYSDPDQMTQARVAHELSQLRTAMPQRHRQIAEMFFKGSTKAEITKALKTSPATINTALASPRGLKLMALHTRLEDLRNGPSLSSRRNMAWRIALKGENTHPLTALRALDMLNKQSGDYKPDADAQEAGLTVNIQNFQVSVHHESQRQQPKDITPTSTGEEFTPITIEVDNEPEAPA